MSIQKKTVIDPATKHEVVTSITCDICGKVFPFGKVSMGEVDWDHNDGDTLRTNVRIGEGYAYHDCGNIEYREYHICPDCFQTKLEPWLESQGVKHTQDEWDW